MKFLLNYEASEQKFLTSAAHLIKTQGHTALALVGERNSIELIEKAKEAECDAILICNEKTLRNIVDYPKATLDSYRGSKLPLDFPNKVLNKLHQIHTVAHGRFIFDRDISKVTPKNTPPQNFSFRVLDNTLEFQEVYNHISTAVLIAYDVETLTLLENKKELKAGETIISCAGWSCLYPDGSIETYVLPLVDFGTDHWTDDVDYIEAIQLLQKINATPIPKVMHNGTYDCTHSIVYHAEPNNYCLDTMYMHHAEFSELPKSLDFVASLYLPDYMQWKDESSMSTANGSIYDYWQYNAKDTWYTLRICIAQLKEVPKYARDNYVSMFKLVYPCLYCAFEGFNIDNNLRAALEKAALAQLDTNRTLLRTYFADDEFNPGSWQQVEKYIYNIMGAVKPRIGKSKSCTDAKNLTEVGNQHPLLAQLTKLILDYKTHQKAVGTYFTFLQKNGRLLYNLNPFGPETGRMSSNSSSFWAGTQIQNIPKYAKGMLIADDGFELVEIDNSQSEARCTAYLAQDDALRKALEDPDYDFYKTLGTLFFQIPYEDVTDFFRNKVLKRVVHGTNYMMGAKTFLENIGAKILHEAAGVLGYTLTTSPTRGNKKEMTLIQFCTMLLNLYHEPFNKIRPWYKDIQYEVSTTGYLKSPSGYTRRFFGDIVKNHSVLRGAVAHLPQNLSVVILNKGFWRIYKDMVVQPVEGLKLGDYRLKAQVHDSILGQYRKELRDKCIRMMLERMDNPVVINGKELRIPLDANYGDSWGTESLIEFKQ